MPLTFQTPLTWLHPPKRQALLGKITAKLPTLHSTSQSHKEGTLNRHQALGSVLKSSRSASVEDMEDEEPMHIGGTLDVDDNTIMQPAGDTTESDGTNRTGTELRYQMMRTWQLMKKRMNWVHPCNLIFVINVWEAVNNRTTYKRLDCSNLCLL